MSDERPDRTFTNVVSLVSLGVLVLVNLVAVVWSASTLTSAVRNLDTSVTRVMERVDRNTRDVRNLESRVTGLEARVEP